MKPWQRALATVAVLAQMVVRSVPAQSARLRDSAGVQIVENPSAVRSATVYRLADEPSFDIGGLNEHERRAELSYAIGAWRLRNGEIAVPDGYELKFFDSRGRFLRTFGRRGEGPREFPDEILQVCPGRGDTLVVLTGRTPRITVFANPALYLRTSTYTGTPSLSACINDGKILAQGPRSAAMNESGPTAQQLLLDNNGKQLKSLGFYPVDDYSTILPRFGYVTAYGTRLISGNGLHYEYRVYDLTGKLTHIVRTADREVPFTRGDAEERFKFRIKPGTPGQVVAQQRSQFEAMPRPRTWTAYTRLQVDEIGRVWLSDTPRSHAVLAIWSVFSPDGRLLGRVNPNESEFVRTHEQVTLVRWTDREAVISYVDGDGAPHVAFLALQVSSKGK